MVSFDLTTERWIPVTRLDGTAGDVSLRDLLINAHTISRISGDLPTQDFALLRLALAVLHRATNGPRTRAEWVAAWKAPTLDAEAITTYLDTWQHRFDLLHPVEPFYQVPDLRRPGKDGAEATVDNLGVRKLIADIPDGKFTYSSRTAEGLESISFADAARWLVHIHAFDTAGIKSPAEGSSINKKGRQYGRGVAWAGLINPTYLRGDNLKETLLLNLTVAAESDLFDEDLPAWERPHAGPDVDDRPVSGKVDLFTRQCRRVRLLHDDDRVTGSYICYGDRPVIDQQKDNEPMSTWQLSKEGTYQPPLRPSGANLWRGLTALLAHDDTSHTDDKAPHRPATITALAGHKVFPRGFKASVITVDMTYDKQGGRVIDVTEDVVDIAPGALNSPRVGATVVDALKIAEDAVDVLVTANRILAVASGFNESSKAKAPIPARDIARMDGYSRLAQEFHEWVATLNPDDIPNEVLTPWKAAVTRTVNDLWTGYAAQFTTLASAGRPRPKGPDGSTASAHAKWPTWLSVGTADQTFNRLLAKSSAAPTH